MFYAIEVDIDGQSKMGIMTLDSCLYFCGAITTPTDYGETGGCDCEDIPAGKGDEQVAFIDTQLATWADDDTIIWKVLQIHHPLWHINNDGDEETLIYHLLEKLEDSNFDIIIHGHTHVMAASYYPLVNIQKRGQLSQWILWR